VSERYLLPCTCGRQTAIERRQAGQTISCACGASLQAPTLLDMSTLELAPPETAAPSGAGWGLVQQLRLLGIVLVLAAVGGGIWLFVAQPVSRFSTIDPERIREGCQKYTPSQTWEAWEYMQQGLDRRIDQSYAAAMSRFRMWQVVVGVTALCGAAMIGTAIAMGKGLKTGSTPSQIT
jgi:hypothetical protein